MLFLAISRPLHGGMGTKDSFLHSQRLPILVTIISASALGLFWLPLRAFAENGLTGGWATLALFVAPIVVMLPLALIRLGRGQPIGIFHVLTGLLTGGALALYSESLLLTDVARALILFYVTPVWSTLLELVFLKRPLTRARALALVLGLAGLVTILGGRTGIPLPQNAGDVLALLAGVVWACGSFRVRLAPSVGLFEEVFSFFFYGSLVALAMALIPTTPAVQPPDLSVLVELLPWLAIAAIAYMIPIFWGILWGSKHIDSGRLGILLQIEAVVGIASAAILTDEPFGLVEILGTALVISAGLVDVLGSGKSPAIPRQSTQ